MKLSSIPTKLETKLNTNLFLFSPSTVHHGLNTLNTGSCIRINKWYDGHILRTELTDLVLLTTYISYTGKRTTIVLSKHTVYQM